MPQPSTDAVVAKSFTAVATRLRGPQAALELFDDPGTDPQLARLLVSNYNSHLRPEIGDVRFLSRALQHYLGRSLPWLTKLGPKSGTTASISCSMRCPTNPRYGCCAGMTPERSTLLRLLTAITDSTPTTTTSSRKRDDLQAALTD